MTRTHENTEKHLLSHGAHGWALALIIDVVENLRRQETKLPAVPLFPPSPDLPICNIISEGWPPAALYPITLPCPGMSTEEHSPTVDMHTSTGDRSQTDTEHSHTL